MRELIALAAALGGGLTVATAVRNIRIMSSRGRALLQYASGQVPPTFTEKVGEILSKRIRISGVENYQKWLFLEGRAPTHAKLLGTSAITGGIFMALAILLRVPILFLLAAIGFVFPIARLRSQANTVKRRVQRSLPEMAALMAAEMAAGNPPTGLWSEPQSGGDHSQQ